MNRWEPIYKCRLCGKLFTFSDETIGEAGAHMAVEELAFYGKGRMKIAQNLLEKHVCEDDSVGIADFQGFKKVVIPDAIA